jgi:hypothetical protein
LIIAKILAKYVAPRIPLSKQIAPPAEKALDLLVLDLVEIMHEAFSTLAYYWDRRTVRSTGEVAGSPRNIIDTGELDQSLRLVKKSKQHYDLLWTAAYASIVLMGGVRRSDGTITLGRDWIGWGLASVDLAELFTKYLRRFLK